MVYEMLTGQQLLANMMRQEILVRNPDVTAMRVEQMVNQFFQPNARSAIQAFTDFVLEQVRSEGIRDVVSHEYERVDRRLVLSPAIDSEALDLICAMLSVAEERPSMRELMSHSFFQVEYPEVPSSDPENNRFRVTRVLQDINAGEAATNTAKAMKTPQDEIHHSPNNEAATEITIWCT